MENDLTLPARFSKILDEDEAMRLHARYLTDFKGAMWPEPFVVWAYKNGFKLTEVEDDTK